MTPELQALHALDTYPVDSWERHTVLYQLTAYLDACYEIIASNATRMARLARIDVARDRLAVALSDISIGKEPLS